MGVMDKILNVMRLSSDDDYDYDNEEYDDYEDDYKDKPSKSTKQNDYDEFELSDKGRKVREKTPAKSQTKITPMRPSKTRSNGMEVCVIKPTSIEDAREITETLLQNRTVVLNMEGLDVEIAQRIIDFTSGSCFAIDGNLQKVSNYIFIITPSSVDISGDFQDIMDAFETASIQTNI